MALRCIHTKVRSRCRQISKIAAGSCYDAFVVCTANGSCCDAFVVRIAKGSCYNAFVVHISNGGYSDAFVVHTANDSCDASVVNSEPIIHN